MYPPKVIKPPFWQITQNSPTILQFGPRKMETLKLQQIVQNPLSSPILTGNPTELTKLAQIFNYSSILLFRHL